MRVSIALLKKEMQYMIGKCYPRFSEHALGIDRADGKEQIRISFDTKMELDRTIDYLLQLKNRWKTDT